ncbi:hypothetical protein [Nonomuraea fuscirosea]|uniref:hypothetical protein n=1 Tax=Nonomuraea fuscirosea TaxID=1291556 RepID=UPI0033CE9429
MAALIISMRALQISSEQQRETREQRAEALAKQAKEDEIQREAFVRRVTMIPIGPIIPRNASKKIIDADRIVMYKQSVRNANSELATISIVMPIGSKPPVYRLWLHPCTEITAHLPIAWKEVRYGARNVQFPVVVSNPLDGDEYWRVMSNGSDNHVVFRQDPILYALAEVYDKAPVEAKTSDRRSVQPCT